MSAAGDLIQEINAIKNETLYQEVGRLTRGLHNALRDFHLDIHVEGHHEVEHELSEMADARSRLNYVIRLTEDAANHTMDRAEEAAPVAQALLKEATEIQQRWQQFLNSDAAKNGDSELFHAVSQVLGKTAGDMDRLNDHFNAIVLAQAYQDLSGQVIKRVIELVSDVENSLVRLVSLAANVEAVAGISSSSPEPGSAAVPGQNIKAEGPQHDRSRKHDVVAGQDDVDELLSSLGF